MYNWGLGKTERGSRCGDSGICNKCLRLVNFINTNILPKDDHFLNILEYTFFSNLFHIILFIQHLSVNKYTLLSTFLVAM